MLKLSFCKWIKFFAAFVIIFAMVVQNKALAFDGSTHEYVTTQSVKTLCDKDEMCNKFYDDEAVRKLKVFCVMPDKDENSGVYKDHFYNIATGHNFMGERMSALAKIKIHYCDAVLYYKSGNYAKAWEELGRAIHFLEDVITPVHAGYDCPMDAVNKLGMHVDFEKTCTMVQEDCAAEICEAWLRYFVDNSLEDIAKMCSRIAGDNFFSLEKGYGSKDRLARLAIVDAQRVVMGLLYKFFMEVQDQKFMPALGVKGGYNA